MSIKIGSKVLYRADEKSEWLKGVVFAVRSYDDQRNKKLVTMYLVDTGNDERVDEVTTTAADRELNKRVEKHLNKGADIPEAVDKAMAEGKLPTGKPQTEVTRYPEQVEVSPDNIKEA